MIWRLLEIFNSTAIRTWLMPRVAISELTRNRTTMIPLSSPTRQHRTTEPTATRAIGTDWWFAPNQFTTTSDRPIIAPMDRS